jgi:hypothetical protein
MDEALKQLHDLHLPAPPGLWPPAPGWWLLAALGIGLLIFLGLRWYRLNRRRRPFRIAVDALDRLLQDVREQRLPAREFADGVNALLKRALIHGAHRHEVAPLTGAPWLVYLDRLAASDVFSIGAGGALGNDRFARDFLGDPEGLYAAARQVLLTLRAEKPVPHG